MHNKENKCKFNLTYLIIKANIIEQTPATKNPIYKFPQLSANSKIPKII